MRAVSYVLGLLVAVTSVACAAPAGDETSSESTAGSDLTSARNKDVQVLKVYDAPSFGVVNQSIYKNLDQRKCEPEGKTWAEIEAWDVDTSGWLTVTLDCTKAFEDAYGFPSMRAVKATGSRSKKSQERYYGTVAFSNSDGLFWVKTVELVVKESAIAAPSLNGIGFYLNSFSFPYYQPHPAPGPNNGGAWFVTADQVRQEAAMYPAATLRSGDKARVVKVLLPGSVQQGGSTYAPSFYFRPFVEYLADGEKHQRWDEVANDYFVGQTTSFDRAADLLAN